MNIEQQQRIVATIENNEKRFLEYNAIKLQNLYDSIDNPEIIELFETIPLFLHLNIAGLPGYIEAETMITGIYDYTPSDQAFRFLKRHFPSVAVKTALELTTGSFVKMFALMGSGGTIAFNRQSDLDFWICYDEHEVSRNYVHLFKIKCQEIAHWIFENYNIEVHFYLNDANKVKNNIFDDDDEEESLVGISLGQLLKEEFFRSSIVLHGKLPFWWMVPHSADDKTYLGWMAVNRNTPHKDDYIDIGNLYNIIEEDFLIAALFQIIKSLNSPFKSIIKLGLLEKYIHKSSENPFISNIIKKNVQNGLLGNDQIDAYIIMFNQVYDYYETMVQDKRMLEILCNSFYLKVSPNLSRIASGDPQVSSSDKLRIMRSYMEKWHWTDAHMTELDEFDNWGIDSANKMLNSAKKYILTGYKSILSNLESKNVKRKFSTKELTGISRKIYSHFLVADNKIDNTLSFKNYPPEKLLTIEFIRDKDGREYWMLFKRIIVDDVPQSVILYKNKYLFNLVVWVSLNGLYQKNYTRLEIETGYHALDPNYLRDLIPEISINFHFNKTEITSAYYLRDPFPVMSYIVVNPYSKYAQKIEEIFFLYHNSWGETKYEQYKLESDFTKIVQAILSGALMTRKNFDAAVHITCAAPFNSSKEFFRLKLFIKDIYAFFIENELKDKNKYITILGNLFVVFQTHREGKNIRVEANEYDTELKLLYSLSYNIGVQNALRVDPKISELKHIETMIEAYKENIIQIYYQIANKYCYFFVSDERNSIMFFRKNLKDVNTYLIRLFHFAEQVVQHVIAENETSPLKEAIKPVEIYKLDRDARNNCTITELTAKDYHALRGAGKKIVPLLLSIHLLENGKMGYRFSLPDGALTDVFKTETVQRVAAEMDVLMKSVKEYSYYVSDINFSHLAIKLYKSYSSFAFSEKNRFELLVEQGLKKIF